MTDRDVSPFSMCLDYSNQVDWPLDSGAFSSWESSISDRFDAIARRFPSRLAIQDATSSVTYGELAVLVDRIAAATCERTAGLAGPIALLLRASAALPAAMLGVLAAGRAYVVLDADSPGERNAVIISDAGACAVIASRESAKLAHAYFPGELLAIDIESCFGSARSRPTDRPSPSKPAAIYYTSGSSGRPKGVVWSHRNLLHWVKLFSETAEITCADRTMLTFSASVSASWRSIYCALLNGASLHILPPLDLGIVALSEQIHTRGITIYHTGPALLGRIVKSLGTDERFHTIRFVCIGGERVQWSDVDQCRRAFSRNVIVYSVLTSTEAGPFIHGIVDHALLGTNAPLPVGRPAADWNVTIVGEDGAPIPDGQIGEIIVTSCFIALGYWRGSDLEIDPFPSDPANPELRTYKTGDVALRRPDGLIEFVGRKDHQIKLTGHRIELGEVESALKSCDGVRDAAIVVRKDESGAPQVLAAYCELDPAAPGISPRYLSSLLAEFLPAHMVPKSIAILAALPRLPNFKIDREELRRHDDIERAKTVASPPMPPAERSSKNQETLLELWREVLHRPEIGPDDDFFLSGGDSLSAVDLFQRIEKRLQCRLPITALTEAPAVRLFEACLEAADQGRASNMVRVHTTGKRTPLFVAHGVHGHALGLVPTMRWLGPDQPVYGLQAPNMDWASVGCTTLPQAAAHFIDEIKSVQPHGPYRLLGTSFGGLVVFEMALQLQKMGERVEYLGIVDAEPPTCQLDDSVDLWPEHRSPQRQDVGPIEALHLRVYETHVRMMGKFLLDSRLDQHLFHGELTYICCMGNPIVAAGDRRQLWQRFASRFRLLLLHGPHDVTTPGSDQAAFRHLLRASLAGELLPSSDPGTVYNRAYRIENGEEKISGSMGDVYVFVRDHSQGNIDSIFVDPEAMHFKGWAVEPCRTQRAQTIVVFLDNRFLGYGGTGERRPDVVDKLGVPSVLHAGFNFRFRRSAITDVSGKPRLFVLSSDGTAAELPS